MSSKINTVSEALDILNTAVGGTAGEIPADATKVDALKQVYKTLGGAPADVEELSTVSEMVEKLANVAGGGGGGDFSTATVTFVDTDENGWQFQGPFLGTDMIIPFVFSDKANTQTAVLYKGLAVLECQDNETFTISGNAEKDELRPPRIYVTGDCTITLPSGGIA